MMCEGPLMEQESRFLDILGHIRRFELKSDGALLLHTDDRRAMEVRRA